MEEETRRKTPKIRFSSDSEGPRHQHLVDQVKELHERLGLLQRAYDALSGRLSDQRLAIAESWEEQEKEWGEKVRLSESERETLTANLTRATSETAARSKALTESERRVEDLLDEAASLRAQLAAEFQRRQDTETGLKNAVEAAERRTMELLDEAARLRTQLAAESSRRRAAEDASRGADVEREIASGRADAAESTLRRVSEEAVALRAELEQLRPDHEQLARFHAMVLSEVDALLNDKKTLASRLVVVEAERDAARQYVERTDRDRQEFHRVSAQLAQVRAEYDVLHSEFVRFTRLRLFRYTAPLRATYAALRRLLGLKSG